MTEGGLAGGHPTLLAGTGPSYGPLRFGLGVWAVRPGGSAPVRVDGRELLSSSADDKWTDVGGVTVEAVGGPVLAHGRIRVGVGGSVLDVTEGYTGVNVAEIDVVDRPTGSSGPDLAGEPRRRGGGSALRRGGCHPACVAGAGRGEMVDHGQVD
jgi:hypothetical protein